MNRRWVWGGLIGVATLLVVALVAVEGVRRYAASQIVPRLAEMYGGRVEADGASVGLSTSTLHNLRLYDADGELVLLNGGNVDLGLSLWDLAAGRTTPRRLALHQVELNLRFDDSGKLLTRAPAASQATGALPAEMEIDGAVNIEEAGRPSFRVAGIHAIAKSSSPTLNVDGTIADSEFGDWAFSGSVDPQFCSGSLLATAERLPVSPPYLQRLPLLSPAAWQQVTIEGPVAANATVQWTKGSDPMLRAEFTTKRSDVALPSLQLAIKHAAGRLTYENATLALSDFHGELSDGTVSASGTLGLAETPLPLQLDVEVADVDVSPLASRWSAPVSVRGKLSGQADLRLAFDSAGLTQALATGQADVREAAVADIALEPIHIRLRGGEEHPTGSGKPVLTGLAEFSLGLRNAPVERLLKEVAHFADFVPPEVSGSVTGNFDVALPLSTLADASSYRVEGALHNSRIDWQDKIAASNVEADLRFADGELKLNGISADLAGGDAQAAEVRGNITVQLLPAGDVDLDLSTQHVPLAMFEPLARGQTLPTGDVSLQLGVRAPLLHVHDISRWRGEGKLISESLEYEGRRVERVTAPLELSDGRLVTTAANLKLEGTSVTSSGTLSLDSPYPFDLKFALDRAKVSELAKLAARDLKEPIGGDVAISGAVHGTLSPRQWEASGHVAADNVAVRQFSIPHMESNWRADEHALEMKQVDATAFGGRVHTALRVPLDDTSTPTATGTFEAIDLERLALPLGDQLADAVGRVDGRFELSGDSLETLAGTIGFESEHLRARDLEASQLKGTATIRRGNVDYQVEGELLDGELSAEGSVPIETPRRDPRPSGKISLRNADAAAAVRVFRLHGLDPLSGRVDVDFEYEFDPARPYPTGAGHITFHELHWKHRLVARELSSHVVLADEHLLLPNLETRLGGGRIQASVDVHVAHELDGNFTVSIERVSADELLSALFEDTPPVKGLVDAHLHGSLGRRIAGGGALGLAQAKVAGVEAGDLRLPVRFVYSTDEGRADVDFEESTVGIAHGRVTGNARLAWDRELSVSGKLRLSNVELRSLVHSLGSYQSLGAGRISGRVDFSASRLRSASDLNANFDLSLAQAQAAEMPVLSDLWRFILPSVPSSTSFQSGEVRGRLTQGVAHIRTFRLTGRNTRVMADGTVTVSGRLDLDVTAMTGGNPLSRGVVRRIVLPIVAPETVPIQLLLRGNQLLADRLVYLHVGGNTRNPAVQVRPAPQLEYEALRYFLLGLVGT
jgi:uncharacterized protein involved in outer membrane biogenesis